MWNEGAGGVRAATGPWRIGPMGRDRRSHRLLRAVVAEEEGVLLVQRQVGVAQQPAESAKRVQGRCMGGAGAVRAVRAVRATVWPRRYTEVRRSVRVVEYARSGEPSQGGARTVAGAAGRTCSTNALPTAPALPAVKSSKGFEKGVRRLAGLRWAHGSLRKCAGLLFWGDGRAGGGRKR